MEKGNQLLDQDKKATCFHCGESCEEETLHHQGKSFCCSGCQLVYEVLNENDLCDYYEMAATPGSNQRESSKRENRFDYLTDSQVVAKLIDFQDAQETHVTFYIPLIHCASCIWLLENLYRLHPGVISSRVDFIKKKVQVKFDHHELDLRELVRLLSKIGYEPAINLSDVLEKRNNQKRTGN
jgi:P-type Cu+ transporter